MQILYLLMTFLIPTGEYNSLGLALQIVDVLLTRGIFCLVYAVTHYASYWSTPFVYGQISVVTTTRIVAIIDNYD